MDALKSDRRWKTPGWAPGFAVLLVVLLLLKGFWGTVDALWLQAATLATSFFGGPDAVVGVLWHTLPLALSAAVVTFLVAGEWLTLDSFGSLVVVALIVLGGAALGGACRDAAVGSDAIHGPSSAETIAEAIARPLPPTAGQRLSQVDLLAPPDFSKAPPSIEPLKLLPEPAGVGGILCAAVNQMLGYLAAYNPRLLVASLLAGGYVGWTWQRRLARWRERLSPIPTVKNDYARAA
ncbi:MAG: hypothetical protein AAGJ46_12485 [Planctomycetota bacterium]